ncbi:MAG: hypothetical protein GY711_28935 [bacterium]|nr:hypothetical protein [bacterium]
MTLRRISTATALCLFSPLAPAQVPWEVGTPGASGGRYILKGTGPPPASETFTRTESLDFDKDGFQDVAILLGNRIYVLWAAGLFEILNQDVLVGIDDFCVLPGIGGDQLLAVGTGGAFLLQWSGSDWTGRQVSNLPARHVVRYDVAGLGRAAAIVLDDGKTIVALAEDVTQPTRLWTGTLVYSSVEVIRELDVGDLEHNGGLDVCMMLENGVRAIRIDGSLIFEELHPIEAVAMDMIRMHGIGTWVASVVAAPNGSQALAICGPEGIADLDPIPGGTGVVGIRCGDTGIVADRLGDLMVSYTSAHAIGQLENLGSILLGPQYDLYTIGAVEVIDIGIEGPNLGSLAQPCVTDLDNDGDQDTLLALDSTGDFFVYKNPRVRESVAMPWIDTRLGNPNVHKVAGPLAIHVDIAVDPDQIVGADELEVAVFRRPSPEDPVDPVPSYTKDFELAEPDWIDSEGNLVFACDIILQDPVPTGVCTHFPSMYFALMRGVNSTTGDCFPARLYALEGAFGTVNEDFILDHSPDGVLGLVIEHQCDETTDGEHLLSDTTGSGDELPCLPGPTIGGNPPDLSGN